MDVDGKSFLIGLGLFSIVIGACLGLVAGKMHRECVAIEEASLRTMPNVGLAAHELCQRTFGLRNAAFGLVAMGAVGALLPFVQTKWEMRRAQA